MDVIDIKAAVPDFVRMQQVQDQIFSLVDAWGMKVLRGRVSNLVICEHCCLRSSVLSRKA